MHNWVRNTKIVGERCGLVGTKFLRGNETHTDKKGMKLQQRYRRFNRCAISNPGEPIGALSEP